MIARQPSFAKWPTDHSLLIISILLTALSGVNCLPSHVRAEEKIPFEFRSGSADPASKSLNKQSWQTLETRHGIIFYQTLKELRKFDRKIDYSPFKSSFKSIFTNDGNGDLQKNIGKKIDDIFTRVQEILDMRKRLPKVNIKILRNKESLAQVLKQHGRGDRQVRAWYGFESKTIHLNLQDVNEGMLAHEMAHHIIDHYLTVRPPRATAEILARYVDEHLYY